MENRNTVIVQEYTPDSNQVLRVGYDPYMDANMKMAREVLRVLLEQYPGYGWAVTTDILQGIVAVAIPQLMGTVFKYVIHVDKIAGPSDMEKEVKKAGGEILERFRLSRRGLFMPEYSDAIRNRPDARFLKAIPE